VQPAELARATGTLGVAVVWSAVEAARVLRALDLLISVDSFTAHLAGALGRPVWTLLHNESDWRWMNARDDTPWYPTMRLFRQPSAGNWMAVVDRVVCDVKNYSAATSSTSQIA